ncbi:MAG: lysophospholipid acyltransferase family protein [Synergistaceae bacterium]|nr:lysophospholipid acyltransferase family protein [Synergistaceae bacterium]
MSWKEAVATALSKLLRPGIRANLLAAALSMPLRLIAPRRRVAMKNLEIALPRASRSERRRILKGTYEHLVRTGIEFTMLQRDPRLALEWVDAENSSLLDSLDGRGAILLTGHVGNWELVAAWLAQRRYKVTAIVQETDDHGMIERMRSRVGVRSMPKSVPMIRAAAVLRRGEFLGILPDQHGGASGIPVMFFGLETSTSPGAAVFAYLTKKPLVPIFSRRISASPCKHLLRVGDPIEWSPCGNRDATIADITGRINREVERMVLEAPDQWLAQHRRFKEYYGR